jgi:CCR4-NOT transcription complex subunit 1
LTSLMQEGDVELQYLILQAIANNLRYPNSHTHWYSCVVLHFFGSKSLWGDKRCDIQQLITRVLLERIVSSKPHPWGLLVTFIELLKNKDYEFSTLPFTKLSPEIEKVLGTLIEYTRTASSSTIAPAVIG